MVSLFEKSISERTAKVVVFGLGDITQVNNLTSALAALEFKNVQKTSDVASCLAACASMPADWLVVACASGEGERMLGLLRDVTQNSHVPTISVFILPDEQRILPVAFELGLFSWHPLSDQNAILVAEFNELFATLKKSNGSEIKTAASYLRKLLIELHCFESLLGLEQNLHKVLPVDTGILITLAEAYLLCGHVEKGWQTLNQVTLLDEESKQAVYGLRKRYSKKIENSTMDEESRGRAIHLDLAIVIDSDESAQSQITELLKLSGVKEVKICASTEETERWLNINPEPDLILLEWRTPKINGAAIVQRIRGAGHQRVIIGIVSSQIKSSDLPLLRDMGVDLIIEKPVGRKDFLKRLVWGIGQEKIPLNLASIYRKINYYFSEGRTQEAQELIHKFRNHEDCREGDKFLIEALSAYFAGDYDSAVKFANTSILKSHDKTASLTLLGKSFLKLGQFSEALKAFEVAQSISPMNISRACEIAKLSYQTDGNIKAAEGIIASVKKIDPNSDIIAKTEASIAIEEGEPDKARAAFGKLSSLKPLIADMNNRGVALTKTGKIEEAISLYQSTLQAIGPGDKNYDAISYNLALAYARSGKLTLAKSTLNSIINGGNLFLEKKTRSLLERIDDSLTTGVEFFIKEVVVMPEIIEFGDLDNTVATGEVPRKHIPALILEGHCLYQVFKINPRDAKKLQPQ